MFTDNETRTEVYKTSPYLTLDDLEQSLLHVWFEFQNQKNKFESEITNLKKEIANLKSENEKLENWIMSMCEE